LDKSNAIKANLLGMPLGTAQGKLRKKLLFHLAGKLDMLKCFRCPNVIETLEDFSIEHTESWQYANNPIETFFDVEKIAFSHLDCNINAATRSNKIYSPEGMSWCGRCKRHKLVAEFSKGRRGGLRFECRKCNSIHNAEYRNRIEGQNLTHRT
jgi:transposase-like protein